MFITKLLPVVFPAYLICLHMLLNTNKTEGVSLPQVNKPKQDVVRYLRLFNNCSKKHLQITKQGINANAKIGDTTYSMLRLESRENGTLTIKGNESNMYLCFGRHGKLTHKQKLYNKNEKLNWRCLFIEEMEENPYSVFRLQKNLNWTVSFNENGKPMIQCTTHKVRHCHPDYKRDMQRCNKFLPRDKVTPSTPKTIGPNVDSDKLAAAVIGMSGTPQKGFTKTLPPPQQLAKKKQMKRKRRRRSRLTTTTSSPVVLAGSPAPLVRIRREDEELLRTLRLLKLVL